MSVEDKIKRAEEIYARRQAGTQRRTTTVPINNNNKKDVKLLKKMIIQIAISLVIYLIIYVIQNNNYIFSEEFLKKANELLSYDINFGQMYENIKQNIESNIQKIKDKQIIIFYVGLGLYTLDEIMLFNFLPTYKYKNIKFFELMGDFNYKRLNFMDKIRVKYGSGKITSDLVDL